MKHRFFAKIACLLLTFIVLFGTSPVSAKNATSAINENKKLMDGICLDKTYEMGEESLCQVSQENLDKAKQFINAILAFQMNRTGNASVQQWIDNEMTGLSSEWYVLACSQSGQYDFSSYEQSLLQYLDNNKVASASTREKYAFVLMAIGSKNPYINEIIDDSIGKQGVMSWIYGFHLLNNGAKSQIHTIASIKEQLLSMQLADGGWAVMGTTGDNDVTAMAIQALAPYYEKDMAVQNAINQALALLSERQLEDGDYANYGNPNLESTAQVVIALSALGIDAETDSRFIKNGNTLLDALVKYQLEDGSYSHTKDGSFSDTATVQALQAFVSYARMAEGKEGLYVLDYCVFGESIEDVTGEQETNTEESSEQESESLEETTKEQQNTEETEEEKETLESIGIEDSKQESIPNENNSQTQPSKVSYKTYACIVIIVLACFGSILFVLLKKTNKNNFFVLWILAVVAILFVLFTDFQSADEYYNGEGVVKENVIGTVTLTIRCDTVLDKLEELEKTSEELSSYIPLDGTVLETTTFAIEEGDTVYQILTEAAQKYKIQLDSSGADGMVYISGINYLYEFDFGEFSGWVYRVNGTDASVGCDQYVLRDGDVIEWLYTCELGTDLK